MQTRKYREPSSDLFARGTGGTRTEPAVQGRTPERDSASPSVAEERPDQDHEQDQEQDQEQDHEHDHEQEQEQEQEQELESPEPVRRSSLGGDCTPVEPQEAAEPRRTQPALDLARKTAFEDHFMLDSLNDQRNLASVHLESSHPCRKLGQTPVPEETQRQTTSVAVEEREGAQQDESFMQALQAAIVHFEEEGAPSRGAHNNRGKVLKPKASKQERPGKQSQTAAGSKGSPSSSYNSSNATTANSAGESKKEGDDPAAEHASLRKEYNTLWAKYNELKTTNKTLMNDYAALRSQLEEMKAVPRLGLVG